MAKDYVMPKLAMAMNEGTLNEWLVKEGEYVEEGAPIAVVETEKVSYDVESPVAGYLHIVVAEGETVPVEVTIAQFADTAEECAELGAGAAPASTPAVDTQQASAPVAVTAAAVAPGGRIKASPLAKKIARDAQLDLSKVAGTGPGGRIVKRDILLALESGVASAAPLVAGPLIEKLRIPIKGTMRATIAKRMVESLQTAAQLSSSWECDITKLMKTRKRLVAMSDQLGTRVSINALLIKALACALKQVPIANASIVGDDIVVYDNVNVGIAIALPGDTEYDSKLIVPVLNDVDRMGVVEIDEGMKALIEKARNGQHTAADMSGSTVTFSSTAGLAPEGMQSTPLLNLPNALLIGPSTPQDKPVVRKGKIRVRTMLPISMTFDHRVLDGLPAAKLAKIMHECLENPELMLL